MMSELMLFLVILSVAYNASAADSLEFLWLWPYDTVERGTNTYSSVIVFTDFIHFGYSYETSVYVSTNGYFSIGTTPNTGTPHNFLDSSSDSIVAPFAADIDTRSTGFVHYSTFDTGASNIDTVSSYIRSKLGVPFWATWMVVADWYFVPQSHMESISETNRFQGVIITDGTSSYAVFLYYCPYMRWSGHALIGWRSNSPYYRIHPLSGKSNAKDIACLDSEYSYNTVLFKLSSVSSCPTRAFGCFSGTCTNSNSSRCDGHPDCDDGSDEVACTYSTCDSDKFQCDNGECLPGSSQCDGVEDCADNSDEDGCDSTCDFDKFWCDNGECILGSSHCDGVEDCADKSDEHGCGINVGILALGLFVGLTCLTLCIGIICVVCVAFHLTRRKRRPVINTQTVTFTQPVVETTQTTSSVASDTEPLFRTEDISTEPQEVPPPYNPDFCYPIYPPQSYHQPAQPPYGGESYPQIPAYLQQ